MHCLVKLRGNYNWWKKCGALLLRLKKKRVSFSFDISWPIMRLNVSQKNSTKRKGEGNRKQAAKVSLTIFDEAGKEMRQYTKRSERDQLIKELITGCETVFFRSFYYL